MNTSRSWQSVVINGGIDHFLDDVTKFPVGGLRSPYEVMESTVGRIPMLRNENAFGLADYRSGLHRHLQLLSERGDIGVQRGIDNGNRRLASERFIHCDRPVVEGFAVEA